MNYATNKEKGTKYPIEYVCSDCYFRTFDQDEEKRHYYGDGHYLKSEIRSDLEEKI